MFKSLKLSTKIIWSVVLSAIVLIVLITTSTYFYLFLGIGLTEIKKELINYISVISGILVISIIFAAIVLYNLVSLSIRPLKKIMLFAEKISSGDFSVRAEIDTKDEIGDLAKSLNKMADGLSGIYAIQDEKVKEQTVKIENKIKESEDQNKAILNILEDMEKEKDKTKLLANDLLKFKLAVDNASDQVVITDIEGIVIYGNKSVERITGFKPEEVIGKKAGKLWSVPMPIEYYKELWDTIKNQKKVFISEIQNKRKNGEFYVASLNISPVLDNNNDIQYFVAIEHDITRQKEIDKAKTEFVSLASHQLRTPLSSINWYTEMLLSGDAGSMTDEQKKYVNEVSIGNRRMIDLVDSLLNVSRLDLGAFALDLEKINGIEIAKSIINELTSQIQAKRIKIEESYSGAIEAFQADKKFFRIILQNLLSNAVKYTKIEGMVSIKIFDLLKGEKLREKEMAIDSIAIEVFDNGIGIPFDQKDKIFSKMFRADNARDQETEGNGLGLYMIQSIINKSGGSIWFESEENKGTTFYVVFPQSGMNKKEDNKQLD